MKKRFLIALCVCMAFASSLASQGTKEIELQPKTEILIPTDSSRTITDMAGRSVTVPQHIGKVYATHSIGTLFVYTISPELVAGWNVALSGSEKAFIKREFHDLPVLGRWKGTGSANTEQLMLAKPDLIINMGDLTESYVTESDDMQQLLGIPVVMVDGSIANQAAAYEFLGALFGMEARTAQLAAYSRTVLDIIRSNTDTLSEAEKIRVYYGAGTDGLETVPRGSINTEILDLVGGINIADPGMEKNLRRMQVSMEQLMQWNPPFIILSSNSSHNEQLLKIIQIDVKWQDIDAVAKGNVYSIPYGPYDWFSQPPTLLRILGMQWLGNLLYPEVHKFDIGQEAKRFFKLFFAIEPTDEQIDLLLKDATRHP